MSEITGFGQLKASLNLNNFDINRNNEVKELSPLHKLGRGIADAFRSLSSSGRAGIAARNEDVALAIKNFSRTGPSAQGKSTPQDIMRSVNKQIETLRKQSIAKVMIPLRNKVEAEFGKDSKEFRMYATTKGGAECLQSMSGVPNAKFLASVLLDKSDKEVQYTQKSFDTIKKNFQLEFARNSGAGNKNDVSEIFLKDAARSTTASMDGVPVDSKAGEETHAQMLRDFVGEGNKDYLGAISFLSSQAGITSIIAEQGRYGDGFDFNAAMGMNMSPLKEESEPGRVTLTQDADNFYVSCQAKPCYNFGESILDENPLLHLTHEGSTTFTIPKGQAAPEGADKFLPDFSVQASSTVRVREIVAQA